MNRILIVDDEPAIGWSLRELLRDGGHEVHVAASAEAALEVCGPFKPDTILLDVRLPGRDGISAIPDLRAAAAGAPVVVMTAFGDLDTAVRAVQAGAFDYLLKPFDLERVSTVVARALAEQPPRPVASVTMDATDVDQAVLVGSSPAMQEVFKRIALVAGSDLPVLLTGETGTGKELAARAIHRHSRRAEKPFVATSLAALAAGAVEGELFGHGGPADTERPGLFDMADGGTIFLDEIDAAPTNVQAKLLRTLESGSLQRAGSAAAVPVNVRVIAATHVDLAAARDRGGFRGDLYDRLTVFPIVMPAVADRESDLEPLVRHFLARLVARQQQAAVPAVAPEFFAALRQRPWPGNVRELRHAVEHAAIVARGGMLRPEHLPPLAAVAPESSAPLEASQAAADAAVKDWLAAARAAYGELPEPDLHRRAVEMVEATVLREALAHTGGNRTAAAKLLGLDRATLRTKLRLHRLDD